MNSRLKLLVVTALAMIALVSGCTIPGAPGATSPGATTPGATSTPATPVLTPGGTALAMGTIVVRVTDAPARDEVTSIMVTVDGVEIHKAVAEQEQQGSQPTAPGSSPTGTPTTTPTQEKTGEWLPLNMIQGANPFDLLKIKGLEEVLATSSVPAGKYTQIRMTIKKVEVTLGDGDPQEAIVPSDKLKFVRPFDVVEGKTTILLIDFDADRSVVVTGRDIHVKPVVKLSIQQDKPHQTATVEGTISAVDLEDKTVSIVPAGKTEAIVLDITPQTGITLDGNQVTLDKLSAGKAVTATYYLDNFKATKIEARSSSGGTQGTV